MNIFKIIQRYGNIISPCHDLKIKEAKVIVRESGSKLEIAGNSYLYGYMKGSELKVSTVPIPLYKIKQITDDEWNALVARQKGMV